MRVAFVSQPWGDVITGDDSINLVNRALAIRLSSSAEVDVYGWGVDERVEHVDGVTYHAFTTDRDARIRASLPGRAARRLCPVRRPFLTSPLYAPFFWRAVIDSIAVRAPHIVHVHNFSQVVPMVAGAVPRARIALQMHCEWLNDFSASMLRRRLRHAEMVFGVSDHITQQVGSRFPEHAERCHTLPNGVDVERFVPPAPEHSEAGGGGTRPLRLVYVSRISPEKGLHVLLVVAPVCCCLYAVSGLPV